MDDTLRQLLLHHEIEQQVFRYARACDERDWKAWDHIFLPDATADFGPDYPPFESAAALTGLLRTLLEKFGPTQHFISNLVVEETGPDTVYSRFYIRGFHTGLGERAGLIWDTMGEYQDHWRRTPAGWRIARRRFVMLAQAGTVEALLGAAAV